MGFFTSFLLQLMDYIAYVQILLAVAFGYLIVNSVVSLLVMPPVLLQADL